MARRPTSPTGPLQVVWLKRDLRVHDHTVLSRAAASGPVLPLFVVEPELWQQPDMSARQWNFVAECLAELREDLARIGQPLVLRQGAVTAVLAEIAASHGIGALWSHEETGNAWTFRRDQQVADWCRSHGIAWHEDQQNGTQRRLRSRDGWARAWDARMAQAVAPTPWLKPVDGIAPGAIPTARDLRLSPDPCRERQTGGRAQAVSLCDSFLTERGETYRADMANPLAGATACSRLSPHLAWGTISLREVTQATWARQREIAAAPKGTAGRWRGAVTSFIGRLHWHCHFIQKLEDQPELEWRNLHPAYDGMRPDGPDAARLAAWMAGETGLPFVDACMRSLNTTGWLNFRMRAMVTAVAGYHLWLHWRAPGEHLARQFTDYEPGIHWSQIQMQSGTTGINTIRIYNPVKQGYDQDPQGRFVRRWVPELAKIADQHLQEPWKAPNAGQVLGRAYPFPIVDHLSAAREARQRIWTIRRGPQFRAAAAAIVDRHASRSTTPRTRGTAKRRPSTEQLSLGF